MSWGRKFQKGTHKNPRKDFACRLFASTPVRWPETFYTTNPLYKRNFYTWDILEKCPSKETWNVLPPKCDNHQTHHIDEGVLFQCTRGPAGVAQMDISFSRVTPNKTVQNVGNATTLNLSLLVNESPVDFSGLNLEWPSRVKVDALLISLALAGGEDKNWWVGQISRGSCRVRWFRVSNVWYIIGKPCFYFLKLKSREQVSKELRCLVEFEQVWWELARVDVDLYSLLRLTRWETWVACRFWNQHNSCCWWHINPVSTTERVYKSLVEFTWDELRDLEPYRPYLQQTIEPCTWF